MAKKKSGKPLGKKKMKKTKGGAGGGVWVAAGDVNGDGVALRTNPGPVQNPQISGNTWTGKV